MIQLYVFFQIIFALRLLQDIDYNSLCYVVNPVAYLFYEQQFLSVNPILLIYSSHPTLTFSFGNQKFVSYVCEFASVLYINSFVLFLIPQISDSI